MAISSSKDGCLIASISQGTLSRHGNGSGHPIVFGLKLTAQFFKPSAGATWCLLFRCLCACFFGGGIGASKICVFLASTAFFDFQSDIALKLQVSRG